MIGGGDWMPATKTVAIVAFVAVVMIGLPRVHRAIPASLIAVIAATVGAALFGASVAIIGALPSRLPAPVLPTVDFDALRSLVGAAVAIAALSAIKSLLSARVAAIVHSLVLLAVVCLATVPVSVIPLSALAGVLVVRSPRCARSCALAARTP